MDTHGKIIIIFRPPTYDSPPFFLPHVPAAGGRRLRRRRVRAALPSRRRRPQPIEEGRPESTFITGESFEEENLTSSSAGIPSELTTSGGAGRTKRWAGGTPPLRPNRCGGLRRLRRKRNSDWWFRPSRDQRRRRLKTVLRKLRR